MLRQISARPSGSKIRKKMIKAPKATTRTGDMTATASGQMGDRTPTIIFRISGTMVIKIAPKIPPRIDPIPPTMMAARKKMDMRSGKLSGVITRKK